MNYICDTIIEATGGAAQAEESEDVSEDESAVDKQKSEDVQKVESQTI